MESDVPDDEERVPLSLNTSRDSEQREIDEFEEEERRLLAEEEKVSQDYPIFLVLLIIESFAVLLEIIFGYFILFWNSSNILKTSFLYNYEPFVHF